MPNTIYSFDPRFVEYFDGRLKQVFWYITDACQLRCKQCLYKPNLVFQIRQIEVPELVIRDLSGDFYNLGARKISFLGGEPSLYGDPDHAALGEVVRYVSDLGYEYIRLDTNGQFSDDMLAADNLRLLHEVSFSLDGHTADLQENLRGPGTFAPCVANIRRAIALRYRVCITTCVHNGFRDQHGDLRLMDMIKFADELGAHEINFHVLLKHSFPMDTWTEDTAISPTEWVRTRDVLKASVSGLRILVRIPEHFVTQAQFDANPEYYGYCPVKLGERILVHPDGQMRICSGLLSSKYCIAKYDPELKKVMWERGLTNETLDHDPKTHTACTNQKKGMDCQGLLPLCFSFKPSQREPVWHDILDWDAKARRRQQ